MPEGPGRSFADRADVVALIVLGATMFSSVYFFSGHENVLLIAAIAPAVSLAFVIIASIGLRDGSGSRCFSRAAKASRTYSARSAACASVRRLPQAKLGLAATVTQLSAWGLQSLSCHFLLDALGVASRTGFAAAAAVLSRSTSPRCAATPANLGVFEAAAQRCRTAWPSATARTPPTA